MRKSFPLQWPDGMRRTMFRKKPAFQTVFVRDRDAVLRYLKKRDGANIAITSNLPTRGDGMPYEAGVADGDPGVAVWWVERGREMVIACDAWVRAAQNLRAIEMTLVALRALDRHGCTSVVERAFQGFLALPAGSQPRKEWHVVFEMDALYQSGSIPDADLLAIAKGRHRERMKAAHPDAGGSVEMAAELNDALADAEAELAPRREGE